MSPAETGLYYLQSRYYDPILCRFLNADGLASTGQGILGCNMFAYCGNDPVNIQDRNGEFPLIIIPIIVGIALLMSSDGDSTEEKRKSARERYNKDTIVFSENTITSSDKLNVTFYPQAHLIHIDNSYSIRDQYEQEAIIDAIMESEYYDPMIYSSSPKRMLIEWSAHNFVYRTASSSKLLNKFYVWRGYETPLESSRGVDFRFSLEPSTERNYNIITLGGSLHW